MKKIFPILVILFSCTDLLINDIEYHSIELKGNGWVQINPTVDLEVNSTIGDFTIQSWLSGSDTVINN